MRTIYQFPVLLLVVSYLALSEQVRIDLDKTNPHVNLSTVLKVIRKHHRPHRVPTKTAKATTPQFNISDFTNGIWNLGPVILPNMTTDLETTTPQFNISAFIKSIRDSIRIGPVILRSTTTDLDTTTPKLNISKFTNGIWNLGPVILPNMTSDLETTTHNMSAFIKRIRDSIRHGPVILRSTTTDLDTTTPKFNISNLDATVPHINRSTEEYIKSLAAPGHNFDNDTKFSGRLLGLGRLFGPLLGLGGGGDDDE